MQEPGGHVQLRRDLGRRLFPIALGVALFIGLGIPLAYGGVHSLTNGAALAVFVVAGLAGAGLGALTYFYPTRVARRMGEHVQRLESDVRLARREAEQASARMAEQVRERTARAASHEGELEQAKVFLEHLIDSSPGVIWLANPLDLSLSYISPSAERVLGYPAKTILATPGFWLQHIRDDFRDRFLAEQQLVLARKGERFEYELPFLHKDGTYRWLYCVVRCEYDGQGSPARLLGYALNVTARKVAEQAIEQAKDEAERANRSKSEFLSRMSHELRTPLNAVLGFAELLEMDAMSADQNTLTSEQKEIVERIIKGGQHLLNLINEVLDIARIETGRLAVSLEAVPLSEVIQESLALIAPMAADRNIELMAREVPNPNSHVEADRQRLKQVLLNLLSNAVKYNRDGGSIVLSCEDALQNRLRIEVSDTGVGIPSDKLDQIFLPFSRLNLGFTGVDGTGIGLALSKGLVELMGGEIGVKSRVGEGSTFWVELALAEAPEDVYQHETLAIPALDPEQTSGTRTVLYIEDNLSNLDLIQRILSRRREIRLVTALQGRLGLDLATQHRPDLILLDMNLPDIPGEEVLRRLRDAPQTRWLPVIVISADATAERIQGALAIGARAYLTKPLSVGKLLTAMRETLNQPANV
jgi:PAS domain S-box-containing protein